MCPHRIDAMDGTNVLSPRRPYQSNWNAHENRLSVPKGLKNVGNSCYSNAVLQSLAYSEHTYSSVRASTHSTRCQAGQNCVLCVLERSLRDLRRPLALSSSGGNTATRMMQLLPLLSAGLTSGRQEDAHEYFSSLIGTAQECRSICGSPSTANDGQVNRQENINYLLRLFRGEFVSTVLCTQCCAKSFSVEPMQGLELDIGNAATLESALDRFCATERLSPDSGNAYACDQCRILTVAEKSIGLREAPCVLRIQVCCRVAQVCVER
jgi:ubiquitin carboxyl-terminal hydrolase 36/42